MSQATGNRAGSKPPLLIVLACLGLLLPSPTGAEDTNPRPAKGSAPVPKTESPRARPKFTLPADAIVVISQEVKGALDLIPRAVFLSPEKYEALMKRLAELEARLKARTPLAPSTCKLQTQGTLDGDVVALRAEFTFKADAEAVRDRAYLSLGCKGAPPRKAELDGSKAALEIGEDGYLVPLTAGEHSLVLELELPVYSRGTTGLSGGTDRGFELALPRAAITTLELDQLPSGVKEVRCNDLALRRAGESRALGPVERLAVTWKKPPAATGNGALLAVDGKITVHVEDKLIVTEADLTLQDLRGRTREWVLEAPVGSTLEVVPLGERSSGVPGHTVRSTPLKEKSRGPLTLHLIQLKEPSPEPFRVLVHAQKDRTGGRIRIDPVRVVNAERQPGTVIHHQEGILQVTAPPDVRLEYHPPARETQILVGQRKSVTKPHQDIQDVFHYWIMPGPGRPNQPRPFLLELEVKTIQGVVETWVEQHLELKKTLRDWEVTATTKIHFLPRWKRVNAVEIQLPVEWPDFLPLAEWWPRARYELRSVSLQSVPVESIPPDSDRRLRILLADKKDSEFTLVLKGVYRLPRGSGSALLDLPLPLKTQDRGGDQVELTLDPSTADQQLVVQEDGQETPGQGTLRYQATTETAPSHLHFSWQPQHAAPPLRMEVEVTFLDRRVLVEQRVQGPDQGARARVFRLLGHSAISPEQVRAVADSLMVRGALPPHKDPPPPGTLGAWEIAPDPRTSAAELSFSFPLPAAGRVAIPLLWPAGPGTVETRVRVWSESAGGPGSVALVDASRWKEGKIEIVPERDRLPLLVLHGVERDLPLALQLAPSGQPALATVLIERSLIQVHEDREKGLVYRARYRIKQWTSRSLDVELPSGGAVLDVVRLNGKLVSPRAAETGTGQPDRGPEQRSRRFRVAFDPTPGQPAVILDLVFHFPLDLPESDVPGRPRLFRGAITTLRPPVLIGAMYLDRVRWNVDLPGEMVLSLDRGAVAEQTWGWRGWLVGPRPALASAELDTWVTGARKPGPTSAQEANLLCWQNRPQPLTILRVEETAWLLFCSLPVLLIGLGLSFLPAFRGPFRVVCGVFLALVGLGGLTVVLLWPSTLPALIYGGQPGVLVLGLLLVMQWMLQQRYRRQLVFMPGFTRLKGGSGLSRSGSSQRPREASTVDVPAGVPDGSSKGPK